jgi:MFS family permease
MMIDAVLLNSGAPSVPLDDVALNETKQELLTCDQVVERLGFGKFQLKLLVVCGFCWVCDAMELMVVSFLPLPLSCEFGLTPFEQSLIVMCVFIGMFFGSLFFGWLADRVGRRKVYVVGTLIMLLFGGLSAASPNIASLYVFRGLCGFGIGSSHVAITLFTEYLPSSTRARILIISEVFWAAATIFEALLAMLILPLANGWRWLLLVTCAPVVISLVCVAWMPESARWLVTQGRFDAASVILQQAAEQNKRRLPPFELILSHTDTGDHAHKSVLESLRSLLAPGLRRGTLLLWCLWICATFLYYGIVLVSSILFSQLSSGEHCGTASVDMASSMRECRRHHLCVCV